MKKTLLFLALGLSAAMQAQVLYGLTRYSAGGPGTLFSYNVAAPAIKTEKVFSTAEGLTPYGSLMQASNGKLYGITYEGGTNKKGTLFEYNPATKAYTVKHHFGSIAGDVAFYFNGNGSLIEASNKKLYGIGGYGSGIYEYDPATDSYAVKTSFSAIGGGQAYGDLTEFNGKLYGMTKDGGLNQLGIIFEYDLTTGAITKKIDFNRANGARPEGKLTLVGGKLYGTTPDGGTGFGNLFEYDPAANTLTNKINFGGANGGGVSGFLCLAKNGRLYGSTSQGGDFGQGNIFEFDPASGTFTKKANFGAGGDDAFFNPGGLMEASNGMFYGLTTWVYSDEYRGSLFKWDPATNKVQLQEYFSGENGLQPRARLIELKDASGLATAETAEAKVAVYPNPVSDVLFLKGISKASVKIYNMAGQLLHSETISNGQLNVSRLAKGLYLVTVEAGGKTTTHKVVKK